MKIEWSAHNFGYNIAKRNKHFNYAISKIFGKTNAIDNLASVDIHGVDDNQWLYEIITFGGLISW